MKKETKSIVKKTQKESGSLAVFDPDTFEKTLQIERKKTELLQKYIKEQLIEGTDYGPIHLYKECPNHKKAYNQKGCPVWHFSKSCLRKSGSEKFINLLKLRAEFTEDTETLKMLPPAMLSEGVIAYKCQLVSLANDNVIAEGRGCCTVKEKIGQINNAIKIAKKRAQVDAVLSLGLSDVFTQDEDIIAGQDVENIPQAQKPVSKPPATPPEKQKPAIDPVKSLWRDITKILTDKKYPQDKWSDITGYKTLEGLTLPELQTLKTLLEGINEYKEANNGKV